MRRSNNHSTGFWLVEGVRVWGLDASLRIPFYFFSPGDARPRSRSRRAFCVYRISLGSSRFGDASIATAECPISLTMAKKEKSSLCPLDLAIRDFSSQWFLVAQGAGIMAVFLHQLAFQFRGPRIIVDIFRVLTIVLLMVGLIAYGACVIKYPTQVMTALSTDINETACLSSICITFTSIIQGMALTVVRDWSPKWGTLAFALWWINTAMAVICCIRLPLASPQ
jgi:hypothetical protein